MNKIEWFNSLANAEVDTKLALLPELLQQGESGINYLIDFLSDHELRIRVKAYELLQNYSSQQVQQAIAPGILLHPGDRKTAAYADRIFTILQSSISFNDSFYNLSPVSDEFKVKHLTTKEDYHQQGYQIISFDETAYIASTKNYYFDYQQAELAAKHLSQQIISKFNIEGFNIPRDRTPIEQWCSQYKIIDEVTELQRKRDNININKWKDFFGINYDPENIEIYWSTVEEYLKSVSSFALLEQLWQDLLGDVTCIQEITFAKPTYLKIDPYYSQIIASKDNFVFVDGDEELLFLPPEEAEISFLRKALNHSQLAIRILAYQLLRGIDTETARQAINGGIKLNPGDKIYSVYQAGICYTDQDYFMHNDVKYLDNLQKLIYGCDWDEYDDPRRRTKRIYCYLNKEEAEVKAQKIHREMIHNNGIGIGAMGFEWYKENPKFNVRQWCKEHNISEEVMWKIEYSIEDEYLADNFRRSKYIYHPEHIDTWCKDNQVEYDPNLDNWDNYRKVIDYLYLPENIELLSKFWKDGVGNFAFVREEIVQEQIQIKPEKSFMDLSQVENTKLQSLLKPENYPELASKFLINIIEDDLASTEHKAKARELLQKISWEHLPF